MEEHRKEVAELKEKVKNTDANHQKQLQTKKFLIDKLKEERVNLQRYHFINDIVELTPQAQLSIY